MHPNAAVVFRGVRDRQQIVVGRNVNSAQVAPSTSGGRKDFEAI